MSLRRRLRLTDLPYLLFTYRSAGPAEEKKSRRRSAATELPGGQVAAERCFRIIYRRWAHDGCRRLHTTAITCPTSSRRLSEPELDIVLTVQTHSCFANLVTQYNTVPGTSSCWFSTDQIERCSTT